MPDYDTNWDDKEVSPAKLNVISLFTFANQAALPTSGYETGAKAMVQDTGAIYENTGNKTTSTWTLRNTTDDIFLGNGSDGDVTISADTDLGTDNVKQYKNLTIDATRTLKANSPFFIFVTGTLTLNGTITTNKVARLAGGAGGGNGGAGGASGQSGGIIIIICKSMAGTGIIDADAVAGLDGANGVSGSTGFATGNNGNTENTAVGNVVVVGVDVVTSKLFGGAGGGGGVGNNPGTGGAGGGNTNTGKWNAFVGAFVRNRLLSKILSFMSQAIAAGSGGGGGQSEASNAVGGGGGGSGSNSFGLGGTGGAGGTGTSATGNRGGGGGGGGGSGGLIILLVYTGNVPAITLNARGGAGGNGGNGAIANSGRGGGGGGGSGGLIEVYGKKSATDSSVKNVGGGAAGAAGAGTGTGGAAGAAGAAGSSTSNLNLI